METGFSSSGTVIAPIQQEDGHWELVVAQVNVVPVTAADEGAMDVVTRAAAGTISAENISTMDRAAIARALRDVADYLESQPG
jgi:hypothetical protein